MLPTTLGKGGGQQRQKGSEGITGWGWKMRERELWGEEGQEDPSWPTKITRRPGPGLT